MPVGDNFDFDVFISYSHKDEEWVTKTLLSRLENADLKVCIDFRDFEPGKAALHNIRDAAKRSQRTLLVMTPNWASSEWTLYESILARTSDPAGLKKRTIPLLLEKCEIPEDISILTYVDFTRPDREDIAWRQLLTALGKPPEQEPPTEPQRGNWYLVHPYPMPPNFTGRAEERKMLTDWLVADAAHPLLVLRALGGFGKSALAWHWLTHDIAHATWPRVVWWSFYEGDASFDHFLAETLYYLSGGKSKPDKLSVNEVKMLTEMLHVPGTLLVLDGFERALRAFGGMNAAYRGDEVANSELNDRDCISPLVENFLCACATLPNIRAKILLTTRLRPCVLEAKGGGFLQGCREEELKQMQPADAVEFFRVQGIRGTHTEIEQACAPYGYHPLSLRLLAGLIVSDFQQPGDIAATKRLDVSGDLVQRKHHVLETAYNSLAPARRVLLARIACFRSPVKYDALRELAIPDSILRKEAHSEKRSEEREKSERNVTLVATTKELDANLRDLVMRGLLHYDTKEGRFDLHPIVRRYVYDRLAAPDRVIAHARLRDYFAAVPKPDKVTRLEDLAPVIELYHHTVRTGQYDEAFTLFRDRLEKATYDHFGAYLLRIDLLCALFPEGENRLPHLKKDSDQAWTLNSLANSYSLSGQPRRAVPMYEASIDIDDRLGDKLNLAIDLENLSYMAQIHIGALRAGDVNLHRSIALCREIKNEFWEAVGYAGLAMLLIYRSAYAESETKLTIALMVFEKQKDVQSQGLVWAYRALRELLRLRSDPHSSLRTPHSAIVLARRALELADETARRQYPFEHDYVRSHWILGAAYRVACQTDEAERHLHEALDRCRRISAVDGEADILIDLARLRSATGALDEAQRFAEEALVITERSHYVLQGADAHLELAKLALVRGDKATALEYAKEARRLAICDGPPDYTYKVAYDEAGALLAQLRTS